MKRLLSQIAFFTAALLSLLLAAAIPLRAVSGACENRRLRSEFYASGVWWEYQQQVPLSDIIFSCYEPLFADLTAPVGCSAVFEAGAPIRYYEETDGKKTLAFEIPAGTVLEWSSSEPNGYGFNGFPTYERGWRWVRPFQSADGSGDDAWYYVRAKDLEKAAGQMLSSSPFLQSAVRAAGLTEAEAAFALVHRADWVFCRRGVYISPDLFEPWPRDCACLAVLLVLAVTALWVFRRAGGGI